MPRSLWFAQKSGTSVKVQQHGTNCLMVAGLPQLMFRLCLAVQRQATLETHQLQNKQSAKCQDHRFIECTFQCIQQSGSVVGSLSNSTTVKVVAQKSGSSVNGNKTWYKLSTGGWITAAYVKRCEQYEQSINRWIKQQ